MVPSKSVKKMYLGFVAMAGKILMDPMVAMVWRGV
jgi:hypothetical protein